MSSRLIASGVERLLTNLADGEKLRPNTAEQKYATYVNDLGAVHTVIVDVEHLAADGEQLIKWFDHTRTAVEHLFAPNVPGDRSNHEKVLEHANGQSGQSVPSDTTQDQEGGF